MTIDPPETLDAADVARVRAVVAALRRSDLRDVSEDFYGRLFAKAPELRGLFRDDIGAQGMRFMGALGVLADAADRPERMEAELRELGRGHAAYGVTAEMFAPMREALLETLRARLGAAAFPAESERAVGALYDRAADAMLAAA